MSAAEVQNWTALYAATTILCLIAAVLAAVTVAFDCVRARPWRGVRTWRSAILLLPRLWLRWQIRYLHGTPAILAIVVWFALTLDWTR